MDGVIGFVIGVVLSGLAVGLAVYSDVNGAWKKDCEQVGYHRDTSVEAKVYKCELKSPSSPR